MKSVKIIALLLLLNASAFSQIIRVSGSFIPDSKYKTRSGEDVEGASVSYHTANFMAAMPIYFSKDSVSKMFSMWTAILTGTYADVSTENTGKEYPDKVVNSMFMISNLRSLSATWFSNLMLGGGFMAEQNHINSRTLVYMATVNFYKRYGFTLLGLKSHFDLGFGFMSTNTIGPMYIFIMPYTELSIGEKFAITIKPNESSIKFSPNESFSIAAVNKSEGVTAIVSREEHKEKREKRFNIGQTIVGIEPMVQLGDTKFYISSLIGYAYNRNYSYFSNSSIVFLKRMFRSKPEAKGAFYINGAVTLKLF